LTATKPNQVKGDDELNELLESLSDFQYLLLMVSMDAQINSLVKSAFFFFTHSNATFSLDPPSIMLGPLEEKHILDEKHFYDLQRVLKRMYFIEQEGEEIIIYDDDSPAVKKLKMKMRENREKVARAKAKKA